MKDILKYLAIVCAIYFAINWIADNPREVKNFRKEMSQTVDRGATQADRAYKNLTKK